MVQKDRGTELGELKVPSLIIHGDEDPLVPLAGGKATAEAVPGAELMIVKGMGYVLPNLNAYWSDIKGAMINTSVLPYRWCRNEMKCLDPCACRCCVQYRA